MTLVGNSLSFSDVRKAYKRYDDEFLRDPKEHDAHNSHTGLCVAGKRSKGYSRGTGDVETALADSDTDLDETDVQEMLLACRVKR